MGYCTFTWVVDSIRRVQWHPPEIQSCPGGTFSSFTRRTFDRRLTCPSWLTKLLFASSGHPLKYVSMGFPPGGTPVAGKSAGTVSVGRKSRRNEEEGARDSRGWGWTTRRRRRPGIRCRHASIYIYIFASSRFRNGPPLADVIKVCRQPLLLRLLSAGDERNAPDAPLFPALPYWMSSNFDRVSLWRRIIWMFVRTRAMYK